MPNTIPQTKNSFNLSNQSPLFQNVTSFLKKRKLKQDVERTYNNEFNDLEIQASKFSDNPAQWKRDHALSLFLSDRMEADHEQVIKNLPDFSRVYYGTNNTQLAYQISLNAQDIDDKITDSTANINKFEEFTKSSTRGIGKLLFNLASGTANVFGMKTTAAEIEREHKRYQDRVLANPAAQNQIKEISGTWEQLTNSTWWAVNGGEMLSNFVFFTAGGLATFGASSYALSGKLLAKTPKIKKALQAITTAETLTVAESSIESGGVLGDITNTIDREREKHNALKIYLDTLSDEDRESVIGKSLYEALQNFESGTKHTNEIELASDAAAEAFSKNILMNSIINAITFSSGFSAGRLLANAGKGKTTFGLLKGIGFATGSALSEVEQELRQNDISEAAVVEALTGNALDLDLLSIRSINALLGNDKEEFDTALQSLIQGSRTTVGTIASEVMRSNSIGQVESKISEFQKSVDNTDDKTTIPDDVQELSNKLKDAETIEEKAEIIKSASKEAVEKASVLVKKEKELALAKNKILNEREARIEQIQKELQELDAIDQQQDEPLAREDLEPRLGELFPENSGINFDIVDSVQDLPSELQDRENVRAVTQGDNRIFFVADQIQEGDLSTVVNHELFHAGLRKSTNDVSKLMKQVFEGVDQQELEKISQEYDLDLTTESGQIEVAEEFLAKVAEQGENVEPSLFQRIVAAVKQFMRDLGVNLDFTDNDIRNIIARSNRAITQGSTQQQSNSTSPDIRFSLTPEQQSRRDELLKELEQLNKVADDDEALTNLAAQQIEKENQKEKTDLEKSISNSEFREETKKIRKDLRDRFKAELRQTKQLQKNIEKYMVDEKIAMQDRAKVIANLRQLGQRRKLKSKERKFNEIIDRLTNLKTERFRKQNLNKIEKIIKQELKKRRSKGGQKTGRLKNEAGAELIKRVVTINNYTKMSTPLVESQGRKLDADLINLMQNVDSTDQQVFDIELQQIELEMFGNLFEKGEHKKNAATVRAALKHLQDVVSDKKTLFEQLREQKKAQWDSDRLTITNGFGGVPTETAFRNKRNKKNTSLQDFVEETLNFTNRHFSLDQKLDRIADFDKTGTVAKILEEWRKYFFFANQKEQTENRQNATLRDEKIKEICNCKNSEKFLIKMGKTEFEISKAVKNGEGRENRTYNQDQGLFLWLAMRMPDLEPNMNENGFDATTFAELDKALPQEVKELGLFYVDHLSNQYDSVNKVYRELWGVDMPRIENYFPFKADLNDIRTLEPDLLNTGEMDYGTMLNPGSTIARKRHNISIDDTMSASTMFIHHQMQMAHFKAYALGSRDFFAVFNDRKVQRTIKFNLGDKFYNELINHAHHVVNGGNKNFARSRFFDVLRTAFIFKSLSVNARVFFTQITSLPAYWIHMSTVDFFKEIVNVATPEGLQEMQQLLKTEFVQNRLQAGNDTEVLFALRKLKTRGAISTLFRAGMITTRAGDIIPILIMGKGIYRNAFKEAKARGLSDQQATKHAQFVFGSLTEEMQQSSAWKDQTHWQRKGSYGKALSMFLTSPRQYMTTGIRAIQKIMNGRDRKKSTKALFTVGFLLPAAFKFVKEIYDNNLLGVEDDRDDEERQMDWIVTMLRSPFAGMYIVNEISERLTNELFLNKSFLHNQAFTPFNLIDDLILLFRDGYGLFDSDQDLDDVTDNLGKTFPAVKQGKRIFERISE